MPHRKTVATALSLAVISGAAMFWPACRGKPSQRDLDQTARQYRARAEHGDRDAQYYIGAAYYYGRGVPQDYGESIRWFQKSAEQGTADAQYALGYSYFY